MPAINFIGPSYGLPSLSVDNQRTINMYPDIHELGNGKSNLFFSGTPGLKAEIEAHDKVRGMYVDVNGDLYVAEGQEFVRYRDQVNVDGKPYRERYVLGGLYSKTGRVGIAENGLQLCVVDGDSLYLYIYKDNSFQKYTPEGWLGSDSVVYFQGYFVFVEPKTQKYYISSLYDGTNIDALDFASAEDDPDNITAFTQAGGILYMFGDRSIQTMANTGDADFPISNVSGGSSAVGCIAKYSVANIANTVIWLGKDEVGFGIVYATGAGSLSPTKISNFAVDAFIQDQSSVDNATAFTYQENGHNFYCLNFLEGDTTWCYDLDTKSWHERRYMQTNGQETRHRGEMHVVWKNKHLISDYDKPIIYHQSLKYYDDNGDPIRRFRRSPHMAGSDLERQFFNEFKLDLEVGNHEVDEPVIYLRYSNDGGFTWSSLLKNTLGKKGDYSKRVIWRRLGSGRDRVWEISINDPIKFTLLNAYVS